MLLETLRIQLSYYEQNITELIYKGNNLIELAATPLLYKTVKINDIERKKIQINYQRIATNSKNA